MGSFMEIFNYSILFSLLILSISQIIAIYLSSRNGVDLIESIGIIKYTITVIIIFIILIIMFMSVFNNSLYISNDIELEIPKELDKKGVVMDDIKAGDYVIVKETKDLYSIEKAKKTKVINNE